MRLLIGILTDHFGFKRCYICVMSTQILVAILIVPTRKNAVLYPLLVIISFTCEGANLSMFPAATGKTFGTQLGGQLFPLMFFGVIVASQLMVIIKTDLGTAIHAEAGTLFYIGGVSSLLNLV